MADLARIKRNVAKMAAQNAPEADIDGYIASEGVTVEDVRNFKAQSPAMTEALSEMSAMTQNPKVTPSYRGGAFQAATEGSQAGLFGGFDDELAAAMLSPLKATSNWVKGKGFSIPEAYSGMQKALDQQKAARRDEHFGASLGGELAGGLFGGAGLAKAGLSLAARPAATLLGRAGLGAAEGAAYGGVYGAGEAKPGERLQGAATGASIGALTGGAVGAAGGAIANAVAKRAMPVAQTAADVAAQAKALYRASEAQGVRFSAPAVKHLAANLKMAAGRINDRLRPQTAGFIDDINAMAGDMPLEVFDEFRRSLGDSIKKAMPDDQRTLMQMKNVVDHFADNVNPAQMTGQTMGIEMLKDARALWARAAKAKTIERIMDVADVQTGQYTQSGLANTITREMRTLYKQIAKGKAQHGWTKDEVALIRQMAKGGSSSAIVNLFAKFAPRGVVSIIGGQAAGSFLPGIGNIAIPLAGHVAGQAADRAAVQAAQTLRTAAALGTVPKMPQLPNRLAPLIPGMDAASMGTGRSLATSPRR